MTRLILNALPEGGIEVQEFVAQTQGLEFSGVGVFQSPNAATQTFCEAGYSTADEAKADGAQDFQWSIYQIMADGRRKVIHNEPYYPQALWKLGEISRLFPKDNQTEVVNGTNRNLAATRMERHVINAENFDGRALHSVYRYFEEDPWMVQYSGYLHNDKGRDLTVEEFLAKHPEEAQYFDQLYTNEELEPMWNTYLNSRVTAPSLVTRERFWDALGCLPPGKWYRRGKYSAFFVIERITANLVSWYVEEVDEPEETRRYFNFVDFDTLSDKELVAKMDAAIAELETRQEAEDGSSPAQP